MANPQIKTVEEFVSFQNALATYHVIRLGFEVGILRLLEPGQMTSPQIAAALQLDPWRTELLCSALCHTGLLERYEDDFALSTMARLVLHDDWDAGFRGALEVLADRPAEKEPSEPGLNWHDWTRTPAAMDAAEALDFGKSRRGLRVLELGGGSAVFSCALAHRDPDCQVTVLDSAENLQRSLAMVANVGISGQFTPLIGDPRRPDLEAETYDLVLVVGFLHQLNPEQAAAWILNIADSIKPGGELAIVDYFHGQTKGNKTMALWELELTLRNRFAKLHSPPTIRNWMLEAGLDHIQFAFLPSAPHVWGLVLGQKPD